MVKTTLAYRFFGRFGKFWSQVLYTISLTTNLQILKSNPIYTTDLHSMIDICVDSCTKINAMLVVIALILYFSQF